VDCELFHVKVKISNVISSTFNRANQRPYGLNKKIKKWNQLLTVAVVVFIWKVYYAKKLINLTNSIIKNKRKEVQDTSNSWGRMHQQRLKVNLWLTFFINIHSTAYIDAKFIIINRQVTGKQCDFFSSQVRSRNSCYAVMRNLLLFNSLLARGYSNHNTYLSSIILSVVYVYWKFSDSPQFFVGHPHTSLNTRK